MAFSFGQPVSTTSTAAPAGGTSAPATGGFSFGGASNTNNNTTSNQPATSTGGGFSFGGGSTQQQQQQQQSGTGTSGGFSFGQPQQQQQPAAGTSSGFSFGQPAQQQNNNAQPSTSSSSLFGQSKPAGSGFSFGASTAQQPQQQQQQQPQQQQSNPLGQSQFGVSQLGGPSNATAQQQQDKRLGLSQSHKFESIRQAWDSNNLQTCRFLTYFYNSIPPGVLPPVGPAGAGGGGPFDSNPNFGRRHDAVGPMHDALWARAVRENPDPTNLVPVLAIGFNDLKSRVGAQESETQRQSQHLQSISDKITSLEQKQTLSDSVRASAALKRQTALHHRLIRITRKSHLLIPSLRSQPITPQEEALRVKLDQCEAELERSSATEGGTINSVDLDAASNRFSSSIMQGGSSTPTSSASTGRLRSRVNELWAMLSSVKSKREMLVRHTTEASAPQPGTEWAVVDESAIEQAVQILAQQQQGINHLIQTLEEDTKSLDVVLQGLKGVQLVGVQGARR